VLDVLVQRRRDKAAALKLMRKLLKKQAFAPSVVTTDRLRSYGAAFADLGLAARHEQGLRKNNRAEVSHRPVRRRERKMQRFKSPGSAQRFVSAHAPACNTFRRVQHVQRPALPDLPPHAARLPCGGDGAVARGGSDRARSDGIEGALRAGLVAVTKPLDPLRRARRHRAVRQHGARAGAQHLRLCLRSGRGDAVGAGDEAKGAVSALRAHGPLKPTPWRIVNNS
jgi:hypothetical protein